MFAPIYSCMPNHLIKIIRYPGRDATEGGRASARTRIAAFSRCSSGRSRRGIGGEGLAGPLDHGGAARRNIVVNVGELLEMATDGSLKATVHRGVTPPAGTDRLSVAFFLGAPFDAELPVLDLAPHLKAEAGGVTRDPNNPLFRNSRRNALKSRLRSHPDVARRHADLLEEQAKTKAAAA
ncbi:2OG-Fe(II) oxygenase family protein [Mesorhizobium yinganensis]|uniref:2OG-Fe(II) oxygenase family protein n=1 Tax=Mesorhizobium yinganensis TaxID=3157707 RepID=UPI0032B72F4F